MRSATRRGRFSSGRLLVIGGAEDQARGSGLLCTFVELAGGRNARVVVITTASGDPGQCFARYSAVFHRSGVEEVRELRLACKRDVDDERTLTELRWATGVFISGGDQSRLGALVGSRANGLLRSRLAGNKLVIGGTSAGATAMGATMILGSGCHSAGTDAVGGPPRTAPGLGLLPGVIVDMHFAERRRLPRLLAAVVRRPSQLGVGIDEDTAILVSPGRFDVLGRGTVVVLDVRPENAGRATSGQDDRACLDVRQHWLHAGQAFDFRTREVTLRAPLRSWDA